jgi:thiosulfate/3-mercaptopyruvate sulfurtransferase
MNWKISILILLIFVSCKDEKSVDNSVSIEKEIEAITYIIEAEEFQKIMNQSNIKIIDFRKSKYYNESHIKGALNIWRTDIEDSSFPYKGMMPTKVQIEKLFSNLGITNNDILVIYDDNGLCDAARLWWILQNYDYTNVKLLNGGFSAWKSIEGEINNEKPSTTISNFKLPKKSSMKYYVSKDDMISAVKNNTFILDTRTTDEFIGKRQKKGAFKAGRIPNSKLIDWAEAIEYNGNKKFKSKAALHQIYNRLNLSKDDEIIVYCHSGVRSAHTTFVLTQLLDYKNVKNYDGSWTEWSYFDDLPIKQDSIIN